MNLISLTRAAVIIAALPALVVAQNNSPAQETAPASTPGASVTTKIAVIDIDRIAAESESGKALLQSLKEENDRVAAERTRREQEIRDLQTKMTSEVLSAKAREDLGRDAERKRTDAQRWLEDAQRDFQDKQQKGEEACVITRI